MSSSLHSTNSLLYICKDVTYDKEQLINGNYVSIISISEIISIPNISVRKKRPFLEKTGASGKKRPFLDLSAFFY